MCVYRSFVEARRFRGEIVWHSATVNCWESPGGGVLNKVLYGEAPP